MSNLFGKNASHNIIGDSSTSGVLEARPQLSIVIPAYNEEGNVPVLYQELVRTLSVLGIWWEIIFIDDGSTDKTWERIVKLHEGDRNVQGVRLSRNFGHQYALFAGLSRSNGNAVVCMDADLQHPTHVIIKLFEEWRKGKKVVNTIRKDPDDFSLFKRATAHLYYKVFSYLSGVKLKKGMADFRLLDRQVVENILQFSEEGLFLRGLVQWIGYPGSEVEFQSEKRFSGTTKYNLRKMVKFAWNGIASFSLIPLRLAILVGILTSVAAFCELAYVVYAKFYLETTVPGWASAVGIVSLLFGILFILLGILGEYVGRIVTEVRGRPRFLINEEIGFSSRVERSQTTKQLV